MAYQPTIINRRNVPGGAECTLVVVDDSGVLPNIRQELQFPGVTASQLTLAFLAPTLKAIKAQVIQNQILRQANAILDTIVTNRWAVDVVPALATFDIQVNNRLAANNIDPTSIQAQITTAWANNNVTGALNPPTVQIALNHPQAVDDQVVASN